MRNVRLRFSFNKSYLRIFVIAGVLLLSSCRGTKGITGSATADTNATVKSIVNSHKAASPNFNTLAARVQVIYEDDDRLQSITTSVRMEKDKTIWIKASILGITLSKILITPDRVSYYETIGNTYFEGDFVFLSELLGTEIDFQKAQAMLLGQSIFNLSSATYTSEIIQNRYKLLPKIQDQNFIHSLLLDPLHFKVHSESLSQPNENRLLTVNYGLYDKIGEDWYPSEIQINATDKAEKTKIKVNYKKIDLNVSLSFPFTIPQGYSEIDF